MSRPNSRDVPALTYPPTASLSHSHPRHVGLKAAGGALVHSVAGVAGQAPAVAVRDDVALVVEVVQIQPHAAERGGAEGRFREGAERAPVGRATGYR
ncbi:hypothetical protein GCM10010245_29950 [Streptomyces spectabilis]|nr:hypothetical protein GCM10010245_29950 [Streptomyces spectabilis]